MQEIQLCKDDHCELPLPFKNERIELSNNRDAALHQLNQLKRFGARKWSKLNTASTIYEEDDRQWYAERVISQKQAKGKMFGTSSTMVSTI